MIVTDALMPNLDGYELCRFVRNSEHLAHLPIILLSALDPQKHDRRMRTGQRLSRQTRLSGSSSPPAPPRSHKSTRRVSHKRHKKHKEKRDNLVRAEFSSCAFCAFLWLTLLGRLDLIDLCALQLAAEVDVDRLPLREDVEHLSSCFAMTVAGGFGAAERQVYFRTNR